MSGYEGIVVLGAPRSGTTLLRRLLSAHPRIHAPPETNLLSACARFLEEIPSGHGLSIGVRSGLAYSGVPEEAVLDRLRELVLGIWRDLAAKAGKARWCEKTAFDVYHAATVGELLGDRARYVLITRHGVDAVVSMKDLSDEMETWLPEVHAHVQRHLSQPVAFAHAWVEASEKLLAFEASFPASCVRVRYEDLVADPAAELTRILAFLEEPADVAAIVAAGTARDPKPGLGDWKTYARTGVSRGSVGRAQSLSPSTLARVAEVVDPMLARLGYPAVDVPKVATGKAARRQYQLNTQVARMTSEAREREGA